MRSLGELACVELTGGDSVVASTESSTTAGNALEALLTTTRVMSDADAQKSVDEFLESQPTFPMIEGGIAEFFYKGDADDVAIACDVFGARQERRMTRIANTDTFYFALELPQDARVNYAFLVDYQIQTDPRNTRTMTSSMYAGEMEFAVRLPGEPPLEMSWFAMPGWEQPAFLAEVDELQGKLVEHEIEATDEEAEPHAFSVYLPPTTESSDARHPVVYVFDGDNAIDRGRLHEIADNMSRNGEAPIIVFLKGFGGPDFMNDIASKIVPFVDSNYPTIDDRAGRVSVGNGMAAGMGFGLLGAHPELFGSASIQTPLVFDDAVAATLEQMQSMELPCDVYIEWGRYDMFNPDENWDVRKIGQQLFDGISSSDNVSVTGGEVNDSTDWASWQNRFDRVVNMIR
ncbi:MAG: alpha/beta hydrolase-fold protein [Planctomycetota bacterium]